MKHLIGVMLLAYVMFLVVDLIMTIYTGTPQGFIK